jgi:zinc-ribbon domain
MSTPRAACPQCGAPADNGRIFCAKCGTPLQVPVSLIASDSAGAAAKVSGLKRAIILIIKTIGGIAAITFWFSRITTNLGILLFGASIVVGGLCLAALSYLDDDFLKEHMNKGGYWPSKPLDWSAPPEESIAEKRTDSLPPL